MPFRFCTSLLAVAITLMAASGCRGPSHKQVQPLPPPPTGDQMVGTWLALTPVRAYRLDLFDDGTGALATAHAHGGFEVIWRYRTAQWELVGHDLTADFVSVESDREPVYLRARAHRTAATDAYLNDVSISLSPMGRVPIESGMMTRERQIKAWFEILGD